MENRQEIDDGGMNSLKGYFDKLSAAAVNEKSVLEQLVLNNTKPTESNESLVALVKKLILDIKNLKRDNSRLKKGGQVSSRSPTFCHHCKKEGYHQQDAFYDLAKNKDKRPGWRSSL